MSDNSVEAYAKTAEKACGDAAAAEKRKAAADPGREALRGDLDEIFTMMSGSHGGVWGDWLAGPLMVSIRAGNMNLFTKLIDAGADVDFSPCIRAVIENGDHEMLSMLLTRGADTETVDSRGMTPLMFALQSRTDHATQAARTLLAAGAAVEARDDNLMSALDLASSAGETGIMQAIIDRGVDVNEIGFEGQSALFYAIQSGVVCAIDVLVKAGANIELTGETGSTPLFRAIDGEPQIDVMLCLLRHGASATAVGHMRDSPLHIVCFLKYDGMYVVADLLLRWGADETAKNDFGKTPGMMLNDVLTGSTVTAEELERTRALLARAPEDRAWRRRGWLVLLRKRSAEAEEGHAVARREGGKRRGDIMGSQAEGGGVGGLRGAGEWLLTAPEGLFCAVLGFL